MVNGLKWRAVLPSHFYDATDVACGEQHFHVPSLRGGSCRFCELLTVVSDA